ncbi:unnamed protein product, partial [Thlaspi arvense]
MFCIAILISLLIRHHLVPNIEVASMDFTVQNITQTRLSANWDLLVRIPRSLPDKFICLQGDVQASLFYKGVTLVTSSKQRYNNLKHRSPQQLSVSASISEEDIGGLIGKNIINDIKEKREVKFGSHVFLTDCRAKTSGVLRYACDETTLRFEPGSELRATASGSNPTCPQKRRQEETTMSFSASLISSSLAPSSLVSLHNLPPSFFLGNKVVKSTIVTRSRRRLTASCSPVAKAAASSGTTNDLVPETAPTSASEVVTSFYAGINGHDLSSVTDLIAQDCVYEDLVFPSPFVGRKAILDFFGKFIESTSKDLQFVVDDISTEDSSAVGVSWHLEWKGKNFPFSKGCSFYRLQVIDGKRQIVYGRDCVEPAIKPGETVLAAIKGVTWLLQKFPQLADQF